jgi:hypothetical protein
MKTPGRKPNRLFQIFGLLVVISLLATLVTLTTTPAKAWGSTPTPTRIGGPTTTPTVMVPTATPTRRPTPAYVPVYYIAQSARVKADGIPKWIFAQSQIPSGNSYYTFSNLPSWVTFDEFTGTRAGGLQVNPPYGTQGTFTIYIDVQDYVNMSRRDKITLTITVYTEKHHAGN